MNQICQLLQIYYLHFEMLLAHKRKIKFQKKVQKLLHVYPTLNNTICFLGSLGPRQNCIIHMASDGKVLKQLLFTENINQFNVLSQRDTIILETRKNNILLWNLQTNKKTNLQFHFQAVQNDQSKIMVFPDTQLVCILQNGRYNVNRFKLSYFRYPLTQNSQPIFEYENDNVWTYEYNIKKGNNSSMIIWFKGRHDDGFQFRLFELQNANINDPDLKQKKINHKVYHFPNQISKFYNINGKCQVVLNTIWEMVPNKFMLVCATNISTQTDKITSNFVFNTTNNMLRPAKFDFSPYNDFVIDQFNFGTTCMFRTFDFENGEVKQTPVYYINNETQQIVAKQKWKCSYLYKYDFPGYDGNLILELKYQNGDVSQIIISPKKILEPKEIIIHFLLQIYQGWDQDALRQVIHIIAQLNQ